MPLRPLHPVVDTTLSRQGKIAVLALLARWFQVGPHFVNVMGRVCTVACPVHGHDHIIYQVDTLN